MLTHNQLKDLTKIVGQEPQQINDGASTLYAFKHKDSQMWISSLNKRVRNDLNFEVYTTELDCGVAYQKISEVFNHLKGM